MHKGIAYSVTEGLADLLRNKLANLLSILTIAVSFTVLGVFMLLAVNLNTFAEKGQGSFLLHIFLVEEITAPEQAQDLLRAFDADSRVLGFAFVSREAARARFAEMFPEEAELSEQLDAFTLPVSFDVEIDSALVQNEAALQTLVSEYAGYDQVDEVIYDSQWQHSLESITRWVAGFGLFLGGLLVFAAIVTTSNIIRLNYLSRKDEIEIMHLVGADGIYVKGPFLFSGLLQGLLASLLSVALLFALYLSALAFLQNAEIVLLQDLNFIFLPIWALGGMLFGGPIAGLLASLLTLTNVNRV